MYIKSKKLDPIHIQLIKNTFYRPKIPNHPEIKSGWIANWQLVYRYMFKDQLLYSKDELCKSEEEAKTKVQKYELIDLIPNIEHLIIKERLNNRLNK